jgi:hypothetical protein
MNTEEVRNHDRRFSGDPPRKLTYLVTKNQGKYKRYQNWWVDILFAHGLSD